MTDGRRPGGPASSTSSNRRAGGAAHISVYRRQGPLKEHEANDLATAFLGTAVGARNGRVSVVIGRDEQRAFTRLVRAAPGEEPSEWLVACVVWPATMLMCTFNGRPRHPALPDAERILTSIAGASPPASFPAP